MSQSGSVPYCCTSPHYILIGWRRTIWLPPARGLRVRYQVTVGNYVFFSSFYSNVNLETVARGLFRVRMIYQSSGGTEIFCEWREREAVFGTRDLSWKRGPRKPHSMMEEGVKLDPTGHELSNGFLITAVCRPIVILRILQLFGRQCRRLPLPGICRLF